MLQSPAYFFTIFYKDFAGYCDTELQKLGLSRGLLYFVLYIGKHPGCSPSELNRALHMDMGHTTRTLTKLKKDGFLNQETNPMDKRSHILSLTESGKEAFNASYGLFEQWDCEAVKLLTTEEKSLLLSLLSKLCRKEAEKIYEQ